MKRDGVIAWNALISADRVAEHQGMLIIGMREVIKNVFVFHQAADKIEITFPVLHAVAAGDVNARGFYDKVMKAVQLQDLFDDVRDAHALEDPAVAGAGQKPQPWAQHGAVAQQIIFRAPLILELGDQASDCVCFMQGVPVKTQAANVSRLREQCKTIKIQKMRGKR